MVQGKKVGPTKITRPPSHPALLTRGAHDEKNLWGDLVGSRAKEKKINFLSGTRAKKQINSTLFRILKKKIINSGRGKKKKSRRQEKAGKKEKKT
jgi:hypothetical protein